MAMPFFEPATDPGSHFPDLLRRLGHGDATPTRAEDDAPSGRG
jgi:hypothetical protein